MNVVHTGIAAALALLAVSHGAIWPWEEAPDPMVVSAFDAAAPTERLFSLQAGGHDEGCLVAMALAGEKKRRLSLAPACADLVPGLADVHWWLEREDGSVAFAGTDGVLVAEFAVADGAAFESYAPRQPIMTLLAR